MARPLTLPGDLECWLRAAWPPGPRGGLPLAVIADQLGCSTSTLRRWISLDAEPGPRLRSYLSRRAILRGRGTYQWPAPNADAITRDREAAVYAERATATITTRPLQVWVDSGWDLPHAFQVLWWPSAHVFGLHVSGPGGRHRIILDLEDRLVDVGEIKGADTAGALLVHRSTHRSRHHAVAALHRALEANFDRRCVAPATLVPQGRSHTLRGPFEDRLVTPPFRRRRPSP